tara:strand:+ start:7744 stop:8919 length:1176 start_codon:yes stop_codon:yes gene_type:complete
MYNKYSIRPNLPNHFVVGLKESDIVNQFKKCPCCKKNSIKRLFNYGAPKKKNISLSICKNCDHIFFDNLISQKKLKKYYTNKFSLKSTKFDAVTPHQKYVKILKKLNTNKNLKILDVGCGTGDMLYGLKVKGYSNLFGVELNKSRKKLASSKLQNIYSDIMKVKKIKFDVIFLNHVLEHVVDINNFIKLLSSMLRKNGKLIINVPNSLYENILYQISYHAHIHKFSKNSLYNLALKNKMNLRFINQPRKDEISAILTQSNEKVSLNKNFREGNLFYERRFKKLFQIVNEKKEYNFSHIKSGHNLKFKESIRKITYTRFNSVFFGIYRILYLIYNLKNELLKKISLKILKIITLKRLNNFGFYKIKKTKESKNIKFPLYLELNNKDNYILLK